MNNFNIDENAMKNIKNMVDNGNISDAISQISPEMIQNFSKILSSHDENNTNFSNNINGNAENTESNNNNNNNNIDLNTVIKISSMLGKINNSKNDPRSNLLNSLKPYLRDNKKNQLDNYMNILNVAKIAEVMKDINIKENKDNV